MWGACELRSTQSSLLRPTSIRRIASDVVMKVGPHPESEPLTMSLVREQTFIAVPAVRRWFRINATWLAIIMDYIPGDTPQDCWHGMSYWRRLMIFWTIRGYIRQLRLVIIPGTSRADLFPGPVAIEPQQCEGPMFSFVVSTMPSLTLVSPC